MAKPITIPNTFANATTAIPLSQLDNNYSTITSSINDANTYSNYAADSGAANAYAITLSGVSTTYTAGLRIQFKAANANSGASTLNVNGQGVKNIILTDGSALPANAIVANALVDVMYDGTSFQLLSDSNGGQETVGNLAVTGNLTVTGTSGFTGNVTANVATVTTMAGNPSFSGNVTISGTNTNVANLNASGNAAITGTASFTGNVGIGTSSPVSKLQVGGGLSGNNATYVGDIQINGNPTSLAQTGGLEFKTSTFGSGYGWKISSIDSTGVQLVFGTRQNSATWSETMRIDSSGNVGIGTSSPSYNLHVRNGGGNGTIGVQYGTGTVTLLSAYAAQGDLQVTGANPITFTNNSTERMRIDSSGNVGIGTTAGITTVSSGLAINNATAGNFPGLEIQTAGVTRFYINANNAASYISSQSTNPMVFQTNGSERMRIDSSGNLLVGTTSATNNSRLKVQGSSTSGSDYMVQFTDSAAANAFYIKNDRTVFSDGVYNSTTASAANVFINSSAQLQRSTSSLRYKENVQDATHGLSEVLKLRSVTYNGKNDGDKVFGGFIAEEVDTAGLNEFVVYDEDGKPDALHYGNMVALMAKAIQEQQAIIEQLKADVAALKGKV